MKKRIMRWAFILIILIVIADQWSKEIVRVWLEGGAQSLTSFLNFVTAWNPGVAFSFFDEGGTQGKWMLIIVSLAVCLILLRWLNRADNWLTGIGIGLIVGGALGNVIDRFRFSAVFDFIDFYIGEYHWPAFNLADSAITIGVACLILDGLFPKDKGAKKGRG